MTMAKLEASLEFRHSGTATASAPRPLESRSKPDRAGIQRKGPTARAIREPHPAPGVSRGEIKPCFLQRVVSNQQVGALRMSCSDTGRVSPRAACVQPGKIEAEEKGSSIRSTIVTPCLRALFRTYAKAERACRGQTSS